MKYPNKEIINYFNTFNAKKQKIALIPHINPDGDAIGSTLALYHYFKAQHQVQVISPSDFPPFLCFVEGADRIVNAENDIQQAEAFISEADLIIICDHNAANRSGILEPFIAKSTAKKLMIDHHPNPSYPVDYMISDIKVCSTSELVYNFISTFHPDLNNLTIASCIYLGIMTDTGNFMHNVQEDTFDVVAKLLKMNIDTAYIYNKVFNNYSEQRMRLMGYLLKDKMQLVANGKVAVLSLRKEELNEYAYVKGDTEGFVNLPLAIGQVTASVLVMEHKEEIKFSFRSKGDIAINDIAQKHFNGGGHKNAAGGRLEHRNMQEVEKELIQIMEQYESRF